MGVLIIYNVIARRLTSMASLKRVFRRSSIGSKTSPCAGHWTYAEVITTNNRLELHDGYVDLFERAPDGRVVTLGGPRRRVRMKDL